MSQPATVAASEANAFMLNGAHLSVSLMPIIARDQQLIYQDRHTRRVFRGDEIHARQHFTGFSDHCDPFERSGRRLHHVHLLVPSVLVRSGEPTHVRAIGISAIHSRPFALPAAVGQRDHYTTTTLTGNAALITP
jgi:hypothetical protein